MKLYHHANIITMDNGRVCDALLVDGDTIVALGTKEEMECRKDLVFERIDLGGATVLPGFIDAHSHITQFAASLRFVSLRECRSFSQIVDTLRTYKVQNGIPDDAWIVGFGYDHNLLDERRHPDRHVLDAAFQTNPVMISHMSGHMGCVNSAALALTAITADTADPEGGRIGREEAGAPNGYLEETAFMRLSGVIPPPTREEQLQLLDRAQQIYAGYGVTTAQEGLMRQEEYDLLRDAADAGRLFLDVVGYADIKSSAELAEEHASRTYTGRFRVGGYKLFLDGSPQGRTAWMTAPYTKDGEQPETYRGYPIYTEEAVEAYVAKAAPDNLQLLTHANGDAAIDQLLHAHKTPSKTRNVIIHAQLMRRDQLPLVKALGLMPSYFAAHTYYWGDTHIRNFGMERASRISPLASTQRLEIPFTLHQDTPVLPPNMLDTLWCAATRKTQSDVVLGADETIDITTALGAITVNAAYQYFEEHSKGTLEVGKLADMVVLDRNPFWEPAEALRSIRVLETIKEGKTIYRQKR